MIIKRTPVPFFGQLLGKLQVFNNSCKITFWIKIHRQAKSPDFACYRYFIIILSKESFIYIPLCGADKGWVSSQRGLSITEFGLILMGLLNMGKANHTEPNNSFSLVADGGNQS